MLCRSSTLCHRGSGVCLRTPLIIPSFSSKGFRIPDTGKSEADKILRTAGDILTQCYLISAYDVHHGLLSHPKDLDVRPDLIFLDSGGYEVSDSYDYSVAVQAKTVPRDWGIETLAKFLDTWPDEIPAAFVSFDHPEHRRCFADQIKDARRLFKGRSDHLLTFLMKPESDGAMTLGSVLKTARAQCEEFAGFDIIGVTEKELGNSMLTRMANVAKLRTSLDEAGLSAPIHVFGALDPVSVCLYVLSGAEVFDGLTWIRYAYSDGQCVYRPNMAALKYGIHVKDDMWKGLMISENYYRLGDLQRSLQDFVSTGSFDKLKPHVGFLSAAWDTLQTKIRGGA